MDPDEEPEITRGKQSSLVQRLYYSNVRHSKGATAGK